MDILPKLGLRKARSRSPPRSRSSSIGSRPSITPQPSPPPSAGPGGLSLDVPPVGADVSAPVTPRSAGAASFASFVEAFSSRRDKENKENSIANALASSSTLAASPVLPSNSGTHLQVLEFSFPSLLSPPNPAFLETSSRGILTNARRPSRTQADASGAAHAGQQRAAASALTASRPTLRGSASIDSIDTRIGSPNPLVNTPSGFIPDSVSSVTKIRFAPLPDPRQPRRYSTGRDIWAVADGHTHLTGPEAHPEEWAGTSYRSELSGSSSTSALPAADSLGEGEGLELNVSSSMGSSPALTHKRNSSISSSMVKLFQPLKFGRSKSKDLRRSSSMANQSLSSFSLGSTPDQSLSMGEPLSRRISTGGMSIQTEAERQRSQEYRGTSIPMRKSNTSESVVERPRIIYPSVAQGGISKQNIRRLKAEATPEPEFQEWGNPSGNRVSTSAEEEDDGSGLAWLKKRKRERELREKAAKEAAEQEKGLQEASAPAPGEAASNVVPPVIVTSQEGAATIPDLATPTIAASVETAEAKEQGDSDGEADELSDEEEEEEGDSEGEEDMTAAELEEEERLLEEARRTTGGAGKEKYHDHDRREATHLVEAPVRSLRPPPSRSGSRGGSSVGSSSLPVELPLLAPTSVA